jgi:type II secretory pathway component PulK
MNATSFHHRGTFDDASVRVSARTPRPRPRGVAALIALVCLSLATIVGTLLLQAGLSEQRYLDRLALQGQGEWLVEAGLSRARAQLTKSGRYSGETWAIPGSSFGRTQNATVRISVQSSASSTSRRHVEVIATFATSNEPAITGSCEVEAR